LIELLVVVLIVGILAAYSIPQYNKSVETSYAESAASTVFMIGQAQRMFELDNNNTVINGQFIDACNAKCCTGGGCGEPARDRCQLVACRYLSKQRWQDLNYYFQAGTNVTCGLSVGCNSGASKIACTKRKPGTAAPYGNWGYIYCSDGVLKWDLGANGPPEIKY